MVLGDEKGSTIEATLLEELESSKLITIDEVDWFEIQNFRVVHASNLYGALVGVGDLEIYQEEMVDGIPGGLNHRMEFSLINIEFVRVKCVACGNMALQLYHYGNSTVATVILCVLKFWRIEWRE
ncbi:unnamed protein product, partial [Eruca vesicaria subsp. sativa]|nr:unnamed protein product [Eruca vesicaria subsp. sativa]